MIAKILSPSKSFAAVKYNEKKCKSGDAELIHTENFGYLDLLDIKTELDYKNYLVEWSKRNKRVESPQFHVAISDKGKGMNSSELLDLAKKWLVEMGYADLPTMFYYHGDTANNHIHIITSRIGLDGKKINDSNERYRARAIINKLTSNDLGLKCRADFAKALGYNYSSVQQFEAILLALGYSAKTENNMISVYREGVSLLQRDVDIVRWASLRQGVDRNRLKQLKAIFYKYSTGLDYKDFAELIHRKFGVSLITFGKADSPYGYTVVDHAKGNVYKGSELCNLQLLLKQKSVLLDKITNIIDASLELGIISHRSINAELRHESVYIKGNNVIIKANGCILMQLDDTICKRLKEGNKIDKVNSFKPRNIDEATVLSKRYNVPLDKIFVNTETKDKDVATMKEFFNSGRSIDDVVMDFELSKMQGKDDQYIIDHKNGQIFSLYELDLVEERMISLRATEIDDVKIDFIDAIMEAISDNAEDQDLGGAVNNELPKRRKR